MHSTRWSALARSRPLRAFSISRQVTCMYAMCGLAIRSIFPEWVRMSRMVFRGMAMSCHAFRRAPVPAAKGAGRPGRGPQTFRIASSTLWGMSDSPPRVTLAVSVLRTS